jgi:hypothetical protein
MFEPQSRLTTISNGAFLQCRSLKSLCIPASVTDIWERPFLRAGITSLAIEEGSAAFSVRDGFLLDFEGRSLLWVIGSPESILIPSAIEELAEYCCLAKERLKTVEFQPGSNLRSIGRSAFHGCKSLESICIPSSVEVLRERCFQSCLRLRTVTFGPESRLRVIEPKAFKLCPSARLVSVPASAEVSAQ